MYRKEVTYCFIDRKGHHIMVQATFDHEAWDKMREDPIYKQYPDHHWEINKDIGGHHYADGVYPDWR